MSTIFTFASFKGGVGRTSSVMNLAAGLARAGKKVLAIDFDPQANLTFCCGFLEEPEQSAYSLLKDVVAGENKNLEAYLLSAFGFDLLPGSLDLAAVDMDFASTYNRERILDRGMKKTGKEYDVVLIDTPPNISLLTTNAISVSHWVIMPTLAEYLPFRGIELFLRALATMKAAGLNDQVELGGILLTRYDDRKIISRNVRDMLKERFPDELFPVAIRPNVAVTESQSLGMPIFDYAPESNGATDYQAFTNEFSQRFF